MGALKVAPQSGTNDYNRNYNVRDYEKSARCSSLQRFCLIATRERAFTPRVWPDDARGQGCRPCRSGPVAAGAQCSRFGTTDPRLTYGKAILQPSLSLIAPCDRALNFFAKPYLECLS